MAAARSPARLRRLLHVRNVQLGLAQGEEARAATKLAEEEALRARILGLADAVSPRVDGAPAAAGTLMAAAYFRERLHQSVAGVDRRVAQAGEGLDRARTAAREAQRDHGAMEKLLDRARFDAIRREMKALEDQPAAKKRHDPC